MFALFGQQSLKGEMRSFELKRDVFLETEGHFLIDFLNRDIIKGSQKKLNF